MSKPRSDRGARAALTAVGVLAVVVAGAFAVGANLGILSASSEPDVGTLAAAGDLVPSTSPSTSAPAPAPTDTARFVVDEAGVVVVRAGDPVAISGVQANGGWTWRQDPTTGSAAALEFTNGRRTLRFAATRGPAGTITASVDELAADAMTTVSAAPRADHDEAHERDHREGGDDDD